MKLEEEISTDLDEIEAEITERIREEEQGGAQGMSSSRDTSLGGGT